MPGGATLETAGMAGMRMHNFLLDLGGSDKLRARIEKHYLSFVFVLLLLFSSFLHVCIASNTDGSREFGEKGRLAVYISPPTLLADGKEYPCVYVQIQDLEGKPLKAALDVEVILTSSNLDVGMVKSRLVIPAGESFSTASFTTTLTPGTTIITASAPGFITGTATLTTVTPYVEASPPFKLELYVAPEIMPANTSVEGRICVQLLDSNDTPLPAFSDIDVVLTSSNSTVLTALPPVKIRKGSNYSVVPFKVGGQTGKVTVTALAQNFLPDSVTVTVRASAAKPKRLALKLGPTILPSDNSTHEIITVQLLDGDGKPAPAQKTMQIFLASSNLEVGRVQEVLTLNKGEFYSLAWFKTGTKTGETVIAAYAQGLEGAAATVKVKEAVSANSHPSKLSIYVSPPAILADGEPKNVVVVQTQTKDGFPAAPLDDLAVYLTSSSPGIGAIPLEVTVRSGATYVVAPFTPTLIPGATTITALAQGFEPATANLTTVILPLDLTVEAPTHVRINQTFALKARVTSEGVPIQDVKLNWIVEGGIILVEENFTDRNGEARLTVKQTSKTLTITAEALKPGYEKATASKSVEAPPPEKPSKPPLPLGELEILGFKIPVLILLTITVITIILIAIYIYLKAGKWKI